MTLETEYNLASDGFGFRLWNFSSNARQGEAMLESSAYITSFDKYDTCQKLDISQYKLFMEQLYISTTIQHSKSMQSSNDLPKSQGSVKNIWGGNKAPSHYGIKSTALPLIPSSSFCVLPGGQLNTLGDSLSSWREQETHQHSQRLGETSPFWSRSVLKVLSEAAVLWPNCHDKWDNG